MKIKLNHHCHLEGAEGGPGEIVDCDDRVGRMLIDRKGATLVEAAVQKAPETAAGRTGKQRMKKE